MMSPHVFVDAEAEWKMHFDLTDGPQVSARAGVPHNEAYVLNLLVYV